VIHFALATQDGIIEIRRRQQTKRYRISVVASFASLSSVGTVVIRWQRMRGVDLRDSLVPVAGTCHRLIHYDTVLLGSAEPMKIDIDEVQQRLEQNKALADSLQDVGFPSAIELLARYAGQASDLQPWLKDAEINRDRNLRLQYMAGLASNENAEGEIYDELIAYRKFPEQLFAGSAESRQALRDALENQQPVEAPSAP